MFTINTISKMAELDDFNQGCIGDTQESLITIAMQSATIDGLIKQFANFCGCNIEDVQRNVCDETGRIECQRTENADGYELTPAQSELWRSGMYAAYAVTYTAYVYEANPVAV